ncbi:MAG: ABC transporter permease [Bacteroidales bacterium]|jgi:lipoprotein-releasing system permease protein|nr:ABC transporter permease [Bacteroidales bacterium]
MSFELFIVKRLIRAKESRFSRPIIKVAIAGIALGIAVMLMSVFVLSGFKNGIKEKIAGFSSHLQIVSYNVSNAYLAEPVTLSQREERLLRADKNIKHLSPFVTKGGAIKTKTDFMGVVLKGINNDYDTTFFHSNLKKGRMVRTLEANNEILVSKHIADKMNLHLGDKIRVYFYIDKAYRQRPFSIVGIYETGLGMYDEKVLLCDMRTLQALNQWTENQYDGYEIRLQNFNALNASADSIYSLLDRDKALQTIEEMEPSLFAWLDLLDSNVAVILTVMMLVSIVVITSTLLIMIFEKKSLIGILKGFGATTFSIVKIFLYKALYVICKGLLYGNILALTLGFIQFKYRIFSLDAESYYLDSVPVEISFVWVLLIDLFAVIICMLALLIPARSISKISPASNINRE